MIAQPSVEQIMQANYPGVEAFTEHDQFTREVRFRAELHLVSRTHSVSEESLALSNGHAGIDRLRIIGEELQQRGLDALNLRPLIEGARRDERAKFTTIATQLAAEAIAHENQRVERAEVGDREGAAASRAAADVCTRIADLIRSTK